MFVAHSQRPSGAQHFSLSRIPSIPLRSMLGYYPFPPPGEWSHANPRSQKRDLGHPAMKSYPDTKHLRCGRWRFHAIRFLFSQVSESKPMVFIHFGMVRFYWTICLTPTSMSFTVILLKKILSLFLYVIWHLGLLSKRREYFRFLPCQVDVAPEKL